MADVTQIVSQIEAGDPSAAEKILPLVYEELRRLAAAQMSHERPGQTLQATALVHEAYVRLVSAKNSQHWNGRGHFFAAAAEAMRRILIERARHKQTQKAGVPRVQLPDFEAEPAAAPRSPLDLLALNEALESLEAADKRKAELVKLRYFAGLTNVQAAEVLGISVSTADNDWAYAKTWLRVKMAE
jgi:RNA polymerase sigma factor (TIGR02999 family)